MAASNGGCQPGSFESFSALINLGRSLQTNGVVDVVHAALHILAAFHAEPSSLWSLACYLQLRPRYVAAGAHAGVGEDEKGS